MKNHYNFLGSKTLRFLSSFLIAFLFGISSLLAQLTGLKNIPGDYASIAAAVTDLNAQGVGAGGVTFNVNPGYAETITARINLTATGTLADPIVFQKNGAGANPVITSYTGTALATAATVDGMWSLNGSDYVTIDGINLLDKAANTTALTTMEYGFGLFKVDGTNGASNNTIKNCVVTLNRVNTTAPTSGPAFAGSNGIALLNCTPTTMQTSITTTTTNGVSSNNKFYTNTIQNVNAGITLIGFAGASPFDLCDTGNDIGGTIPSTGNTIINFGGGVTPSNACAAVVVNNQWSFNVSYNTVNNNNGAGFNHAATNRGIFAQTGSIGASATINNNNVTITGGTNATAIDWAIDCEMAQTGAAGNTISINNNTISITKTVANAVALTAIWLNSAPTTMNVTGNTITNFTTSSTSTTNVAVIRNGLAGTGTLNITNNIIQSIVSTGTTGSVFGIINNVSSTVATNITGNSINSVNTTGSTSKILSLISNTAATNTTSLNISSNNFQNITHVGTGTCNFIIASTGTPLNCTINGNTFTNLTIASTGTITLINHAYTVPAGGTQTISNNSIVTGFTKTGASGTLTCMSSGSSTIANLLTSHTNNNFSNINVSGTAIVNGIANTDGLSTINSPKVITGNTFSNWTNTGTGSMTVMSYAYFGSATSTLSNNTISNINGQGAITAINITASGNAANPLPISGNTISGLTSSGTGGNVTGINCTNTSPIINISGNTISALSTTGIAVVTGISIGGATNTSVFKNKIYNLSGSNAGSSVNGILVAAGTLVNLYNNLVGDLTASNANSANPVNGINITGATNVTASYNTVRLAATSASALFGSSALSTATTTNLTLKNNILVNNSSFAGAGIVAAYRRSSTTISTHNAASNNNLFYAGTPTPNNIIFSDGTNLDQTSAAYKTRVFPADANSGTENPSFLSLAGANVNFLHIDPSIATNIESGAIPVAGILDDYDANLRNVTTPDIGADEISGIPAAALGAPINFASNTQTNNSFNITWDDNSVAEAGFVVYRSLNIGGPFTTIVAVVASTTSAGTGTTYTLPQTGLLGNTTYYYQIVANNFSSSSALSGNASTAACGGGALAGTYLIPGAYASINAAITDLQTNGMSAPVILELDPTYTSSLEAGVYPLTFGTAIPCLSPTNTLTLRPAAAVTTSLTITSANASTTIDINGGNGVIIDGRPGGVGTAKMLIIDNTLGTAPAIRLINDASGNIIRYCDVQSNNSSLNNTATAGVILISNTTGILGNDNNTIDNCDVHNITGGNPVVAINASGSFGTAFQNNDANVISNCNVFDYLNATSASAGINIQTGNSAWSITNNRFYQTAPPLITGTGFNRDIFINNATGNTSGSGFTISGNYIGGNNSAGTGTYTVSGTTTHQYCAISVAAGIGAATSIQNNTITNLTVYSASTSAAAMSAITANGGNVSIGNNLVGIANTDASVSPAISYTNGSATTGGFIPIFAQNANTAALSTTVISNNTIAGITISSHAATNAADFNAIGYNSGTVSITNNTIGSATVAKSIYGSSNLYTSNTNTSRFNGILVSGATSCPSITISGNTIANMYTLYDNPGAPATTGTRGIIIIGTLTGNTNVTVTNNTIRDLTTFSATTTTGAFTAAGGISVTAGSMGTLSISNNSIYNLNLAGSAVTGLVQATGMFLGATVTGTATVEKNNIHSFGISAVNPFAFLTGMDVGAGVWTIKNNMIRLGIDGAGNSITTPLTVRGITKNAGTTNIWNNSIYIGGTGVGTSTNNTFALVRTGTAVDDWRNNILVNDRSDAVLGTAKHYSINLLGTNTLTLNNNTYYGTGTGYTFGSTASTGADVVAYSSGWAAGDLNSYVGNPFYVNPTGDATTGDLHIDFVNPTIVEGTGALIASVTDDFDGQTRSGLTPTDVGADAGNFVSNICSGTPSSSTASFFGQSTALCYTGTRSMTLTAFTSSPGLTYQWQESATAGGPYVNVTGGTGATTISYTTATLTATTYFICIVTCPNGGLFTNSSELAVIVNNPQVSLPIDGTRCGTGTVSLSATPSLGATLNWYSAPTGGTSLNTGNSFTTPSIASTTPFYVSASLGGTNASLGLANRVSTTGNTGFSDVGLMFDAAQAFTLQSVNIYPVGPAGGSGTITVALRNSTGTTLQSVTVPVTTQATPSIKTLVPLNFAVPVGTQHRLVVTGVTTITSLIRESSTGFTYPYSVPGTATITSAYTGGASATFYYYFYDWLITTGCESARTTVTASVTTPPTLTITGNQSICNNAVGSMQVTSTLGDFDSYTWSPLTGLFTDVAGTIPYTGTPSTNIIYVRSTTAGTTTYTCLGTNSIAPFCANNATSVVTVLTTATAVASSSVNPSCSGTPTSLSATLGAPTTLILGTDNNATKIGGNNGNIYRSGTSTNVEQRTQYIITAAELIAAGFQAGDFNSVGFYVLTGGGAGVFSNFTLRLGHTTATAVTTTYQTGPFTDVWFAATFTPQAGLNTHVFTTPFNWNGIDNVVIEGCNTLTTSGGGTTLETFTTPETRNMGNVVAAGCSAVTGTVGFTLCRPVVAINGNVSPSPSGYSWSDGFSVVGTTNPLVVTPSINTSYTCTITANGCPFVSNTINHVVNALPSSPTASSASNQCGFGIPAASVTSTTGAPTPTFKWYDAASSGTLLQTSTSTSYTTGISASATFYVSEVGAGGCESFPRTIVQANVSSFDPISIVAPSSTCVGTPISFSINQTGNTNVYVFTWSALPTLGSGVAGSPTGTNQTFTPTAVGNYVYSVSAFETSSGCAANATHNLAVYTGLSGTVSATQATSCVNPTGLISANVSGAGTIVNADFTSPSLPSNMTSAGNDFALVGGQMQLTSNQGSKNGGVLISNTTGLANSDFQIDFDFITTYNAAGNSDGMSYSYGPDVVALPSATAAVGTTGVTTLAAECGSGTKLKLTFDAVNNTGGCTAGTPGSPGSIASGNTPGVYLMYNSTTAFQGPTCPGVIYYDGGTSLPTYTNYVAGPNGTPEGISWKPVSAAGASTHVTIKINAIGQVSLWLNNVQVVFNQQLPPSYLTDDKSAWKHAFAARTGANGEGHYIDNLLIQYNNFYEYSINGGGSWSTTNPIIPPTTLKGRGALVFQPETLAGEVSDSIDLDLLAYEARHVLLGEETELEALLARLGGGSGGARPKVHVAIGADGSLCAGDELAVAENGNASEEWIVKFAATNDPADIGPLEEAYARMARAAHIDMAETKLIPSATGSGHFATKRFDRPAPGKRLHMVSLGGALEASPHMPSVDYDGFLKATLAITHSMADVEQAFRRMVFNVLSRNRDDHVRQHAYLMDDRGNWRLAPAFDLTFSNGPGGEHYMAVRGEGRTITHEHVEKLGKGHGISAKRVAAVIDDVRAALADWPIIAGEIGVGVSQITVSDGLTAVAKQFG